MDLDPRTPDERFFYRQGAITGGIVCLVVGIVLGGLGMTALQLFSP